MSDAIRAYHFVGDKLRNGQPVPSDGEWLEYDGPLPVIMCERGLHASEHPFDALQYAPGPILCRVEVAGEIVRGEDKLVATRRRILARRDTTAMLRTFARQCALDVIHLWDAPPVVREYLETGNESIRAAAWSATADYTGAAAWSAGWAAAGAAAGAAVFVAAWSATVAAAGAVRADAVAALAAVVAAQRARFAAMVDELFHE